MLKKYPNVEYYVRLSIQFIIQIIEELERDGNLISDQNSENNIRNAMSDYKWSALNKELQMCEKIEYDIKIKTDRKNQIEHHFNDVDRKLQLAMKKITFESITEM